VKLDGHETHLLNHSYRVSTVRTDCLLILPAGKTNFRQAHRPTGTPKRTLLSTFATLSTPNAVRHAVNGRRYHGSVHDTPIETT
jgi:hypothetical protein